MQIELASNRRNACRSRSVGLALSVALASCSSTKHDPAVQQNGSIPPAAKPGEETLAAPPLATTVPDAELIVPGERVGNITRSLDRRTIDRMYPRNTSTHGMCSTGEEEESPCSHIMLGGTQALTVVYDRQIRAERVLVHATSFRTRDGISVGMTLAELVAHNDGRALTFDGFSGELGGRVVDSHAGPIDTTTLSIHLECNPGSKQCPTSVGQLSSSDPALRGANIRVRLLDVALDKVRQIEAGEGVEDERPNTEPEMTLETLHGMIEREDWTSVRNLVASDDIVSNLRLYKADFLESFHPECGRKRRYKVKCSWNGDGTLYELTVQEEAAGWRVIAGRFEPVE